MPSALVATQWDGLKIRYDSAVDPYFALTVNEQLNLIASKTVGNLLLTRINDCPLAESFGYRVCVMRASSSFDLTQDVAWKRARGTNTTIASNVLNACNPRVGSVSAIKYNPNMFTSPDGNRPPWMGLAHEMIHAYNNMYGLSLSEAREDEAKTTGLLTYDDVDITENKIRAEHGLGLRKSYYGLIALQDHD